MVSDETRFGLGVLAVAALLGGVHDLMLGGHALGINLLVAAAVDMAALVLLARWRGESISGLEMWGAGLLLLFSTAVIFRDSPVLITLDLLALVTIGACMFLIRRGGSGIPGAISEYLRGMLSLAGSAAFGAGDMLRRRIDWGEIEGLTWNARIVAMARGAVIALPVVTILGLLLVSADRGFADLIGGVLKLRFDSLATHATWTAAFAWGLAGIFSGAFAREVLPEEKLCRESDPPAERMTIGAVESAVVLAAVNALLLAFVIVQFRYFFGGTEFVRGEAGVTFSEYARHGFFELFFVAAIELTLLLIIDRFRRRRSLRGERIVTALAGLQVLLVLVIVASALDRMSAYQIEYGQTELRFYTTAFMWWIAALFLWFAVTVLRGKRGWFAPGALLSALATIAVLNLINPDAWIASANLDLTHRGRMPDIDYVMSLSADAVPTIVGRLPELEDGHGIIVESALLARWKEGTGDDWRSWNWSRAGAHDLLRHGSLFRTARAMVPSEPAEFGVAGEIPAPVMLEEPVIDEPVADEPVVMGESVAHGRRR